MSKQEPPAALPEPDWRRAAASTREAVKWLVATYGALGAALIGSAPFTHLDDVSGPGPVLMAVAGGVLACLGIGLGIWAATDVLMPRLITWPDVVAGMGAATERVLAGRTPLSLDTELEGWRRTIRQLERPEAPGSPAERLRPQALVVAKEQFESRLAAAQRVVELAHGAELRRSVLRARPFLIGGFSTAALGAGLLVGAVGASDPSPSVSTTSIALRWSMSESAERALGKQVGAACDHRTVPVFLIADDWLVTQGSSTCGSVVIRWDPSLGTLAATGE